jgi:glycerol uptake facilitator-like aquaporin
MPKPGQSWQAAGFEAILTFGLVLMVLNLANGPKLNGPFIPLAVGAYAIISSSVLRSRMTRSAARMWSNMTWWFAHTCPMNRNVRA